MANICSFTMEIKGEKEKRTAFINALKHEGPCYIGMKGAHVYNIDDEWNENITRLDGECKWSVLTSLQRLHLNEDGSKEEIISLRKACEKFSLDMELFSEESGMGFQEHFLFKDGKFIDEDCDYAEYYFDEYASKKLAEKELGLAITDEEWNEGSCSRGGYEWDFSL